MPTVPDTPTIPADHVAIVPCPTCGVHTTHRFLTTAQYRCLRCDTVHGLEPMAKRHQEPDEPIRCPTCRKPEGSPFWAAVAGRRQCRVCLGWVTDSWKA